MIYTDYFEVESLGGTYIVPLSTALAIERALARAATPDWVEFRDVFGTQHRMPALCVYRIAECRPETRAALLGLRPPRQAGAGGGTEAASPDRRPTHDPRRSLA